MTKTTNDFMGDLQKLVDAGEIKPIEKVGLSISLLRRSEYLKHGITSEELLVALWEKVVENQPESANQIQVKRNGVKQKYPKKVK